MDLPPQPHLSLNAIEEACIRARQKLQDFVQAHQEARKVLRRDWDHLSSRKRSAQCRVVKELEEQQRSLEEEIKR